MKPLLALASLTALAACSTLPPVREVRVEPARGAPVAPPAPARAPRQEFSFERTDATRWAPGEALMQGFLGFTAFREVEIDDSTIDGDQGDVDELPLIGGGGQFKVGGDRIDYGFEGLLSFAGRANAEAFVVGGGGAAVAIDVDLLLFELYGGPFASMFLGEKLRLYAAAGPLAQWAEYEQEGAGLADDGSGFGAGFYGRTGLEFVLPSRTMLGLGVRWSDSSIDLGGNLGDLDVEGFQMLFTVTRGS